MQKPMTPMEPDLTLLCDLRCAIAAPTSSIALLSTTRCMVAMAFGISE